MHTSLVWTNSIYARLSPSSHWTQGSAQAYHIVIRLLLLHRLLKLQTWFHLLLQFIIVAQVNEHITSIRDSVSFRNSVTVPLLQLLQTIRHHANIANKYHDRFGL